MLMLRNMNRCYNIRVCHFSNLFHICKKCGPARLALFGPAQAVKMFQRCWRFTVNTTKLLFCCIIYNIIVYYGVCIFFCCFFVRQRWTVPTRCSFIQGDTLTRFNGNQGGGCASAAESYLAKFFHIL